MKSLLSVVALSLLLSVSTSSFANDNTGKSCKIIPRSQSTLTSKKPTVAYFWIFYGPCLQLVRLNDPGYTDAQGNYWAGPSLTFMNALNYIGTTQICPPEGQAYC
jgi:hypothetical protein